MLETRKIVRVFLGSPGDLKLERQAARRVTEEFNKQWAEELGYQYEIIGWEDIPNAYGRPQAIINEDLRRCDLFIGLLWRRWGTPPDVDGQYSSGFEEELRLCE